MSPAPGAFRSPRAELDVENAVGLDCSKLLPPKLPDVVGMDGSVDKPRIGYRLLGGAAVKGFHSLADIQQVDMSVGHRLGFVEHAGWDAVADHAQSLLLLAKALFRFFPGRDDPAEVDILIRDQGKLIGERVQHPRELLEFLKRHDGNFEKGSHDFIFVCADLAGITAHSIFGLRFIANLANQPGCDMSPGHGDATACVPQSAAQAGLNGETIRMKISDGGIGCVAVAAPDIRFTDDIAAETAEVARLRDGSAVGPRDQRCDTGCRGEKILKGLDVFDPKELLKRNFIGICAILAQIRFDVGDPHRWPLKGGLCVSADEIRRGRFPRVQHGGLICKKKPRPFFQPGFPR